MVKIRIKEAEMIEDKYGNKWNDVTEICVPERGTGKNIYDAYAITKNLPSNATFKLIFAGKRISQDLEYTEKDIRGDLSCNIHARITYSPLINELRNIKNTQNSSTPSTTIVENLKNFSISHDE